HTNMGFLACSCGNLREAVSNYDDAMRVSLPGFLFPGLLRRSAFPCRRALALQLLGRIGEATRLADEGLRCARESRHLFSLGQALTVVGQLLLQFRRTPEIVRAYAEEAIAVGQECGSVTWLGFGRFYHGHALAELGLLAQGVAEMEAGIAELRRQGGGLWVQYMVALLAQGYARMDRTEEALGMLNEALTHIERT